MELKEALATLPQGHDPYDTYVFLAGHKIKGEPCHTCDCPVAKYLQSVMGRTSVYVDYEGGGDPVALAIVNHIPVPLPVGVASFIHLLDADAARFPAVVKEVDDE